MASNRDHSHPTGTVTIMLSTQSINRMNHVRGIERRDDYGVRGGVDPSLMSKNDPLKQGTENASRAQFYGEDGKKNDILPLMLPTEEVQFKQRVMTHSPRKPRRRASIQFGTSTASLPKKTKPNNTIGVDQSLPQSSTTNKDTKKKNEGDNMARMPRRSSIDDKVGHTRPLDDKTTHPPAYPHTKEFPYDLASNETFSHNHEVAKKARHCPRRRSFIVCGEEMANFAALN